MVQKHCAHCGRPFEAKRDSAKWCSSLCSARNHRECNPNPLLPIEDRRCVQCGGKFKSRHWSKQTCGKVCKIAYQNARRVTTQADWRECAVCGTRFQPKQKRGVGKSYCSETCKGRVKYLKHRDTLLRKKVDYDAMIAKLIVTGADRKQQKQVFTTVYAIQIAVTVVFSIAIVLARKPLAGILLGVVRPDWIVILAGILFMDALWAHPMHILRATGRASRYAFFSMTNAAIIAGANIIFLPVLKMGITGALLANLAGSSVLFIITLPTVITNFTRTGWSTVLLRKILRFGLPFLPAGLFTMIMELSDRYFLRWMTDMETVGLYSAGYKLGLALLLLVGGFNLGWQPFYLDRGKRPGAQEVFARIALYILLLLTWVMLTLGAWIDDLVRLPIGPITIFGPAYWSATQIVPLILLGYLFFATYVLQGQNRLEALKILGWQTAPVIATGKCKVHQKVAVAPQDIQDYFPDGNIFLRSTDKAIQLKDTHPPDSYTYPRGTARYQHEDYWTPLT